MKERVKAKVLESAGYRELYAVINGEDHWYTENGKEYIKFTYSEDDPYQDANGAIYCVTEGRWVD